MKLGFFSKYFPPPQFLKPPHIGISFSDTSIKAISFTKNTVGPRFKSTIISVEKGSIVLGSIVNMEEVVKRLSVIRKNFDSPFVFFTVPDEFSYVFLASVPTSGGDITEAVAFVIEENVPLSLSEVAFDFVPIQIVQSEAEYSVSVVVTACVKKEIEKFIEAFYKAGFEPVGCVHKSQSITKTVIPKNFFGTFCVIHARENRIGIHLVKDKIVHFSTIRTVLEGDYKKEFLDEYEKFLEYCSKYNISEEMPKVSIFVCGDFEYGKSAIESLLDYKSSTKDAKLSNVWSNVLEIERDTPEISYEDSLALAGPIGAVLASTL